MRYTHIISGYLLFIATLILFVIGFGTSGTAFAATVTQSGNQPVTAFVPGPAPTFQAIILSPQNNQTVSTTPLVVSGTCGGTNTSVRVFLNGELAGITSCLGDETFSLNIILEFGRNDLSAFVYDSLGQVGPNSDIVTITVTPPASIDTPLTTVVNNLEITPPSDDANTFQAIRGFFTNNPFRSIGNLFGINSTSATSSLAVKTATVVAGVAMAVASVILVQLGLITLMGLDPTKSWAFRFLAKIILK